ncbi:MAG: cation transporter [Gammaproteobacteria bacterium]|nr:cation transporter [Gammaproteobacteria bacterium]
MPRQQAFVSEFHVPKMDCPSEERMIRLALDDLQPDVALEVDIPQRRVTVTHCGPVDTISQRLQALNYGAQLHSSQPLNNGSMDEALALSRDRDAAEARVLIWLLLINGFMFFFELTLGIVAQSTALVADAIDMFADAAVYGLALFAVGRSAQLKLRAAHMAGWLQLILAFGVLIEVLRRFVYGSEPVSLLMMGVGSLALIANVTCLLLIHRQRNSGVHMKASWIFSAVDVIANIGVILAGLLVLWTGSRYPDLLVGLIIAAIVLNGSRRILQLKG